MDDPGLAWPFWKFGLKKDDLFTKLHDQYNTFSSTIQDPEAFHHDVFEISHEAGTLDEFHHLLGDRKQQRMRELNDSLESASLEIIANPSLIGTEQWQHALQLFRTKSLDSLVRYFASYLPDNHPWRNPRHGFSSDTGSSCDSITDSSPSLFEDQDDGPIMTEEPHSISDSVPIKDHLPPSPRSMTMCSDSSAASPIDLDHHSYIFDNLTPARSLSFSEESEPETYHSQDSMRRHDTSQPCDAETPSTCVSDLSEAAALEQVTLSTELYKTDEAFDEDFSQPPLEVTESEATESETPTPKPMPSGTSFFDTKESLPRRRHRSFSPSRAHPLSLHQFSDHDIRQPLQSPRLRRRDESSRLERRRSPGAPSSRIKKPLTDSTRSRLRGRRQLDG